MAVFKNTIMVMSLLVALIVVLDRFCFASVVAAIAFILDTMIGIGPLTFKAASGSLFAGELHFEQLHFECDPDLCGFPVILDVDVADGQLIMAGIVKDAMRAELGLNLVQFSRLTLSTVHIQLADMLDDDASIDVSVSSLHCKPISWENLVEDLLIHTQLEGILDSASLKKPKQVLVKKTEEDQQGAAKILIEKSAGGRKFTLNGAPVSLLALFVPEPLSWFDQGTTTLVELQSTPTPEEQVELSWKLLLKTGKGVQLPSTLDYTKLPFTRMQAIAVVASMNLKLKQLGGIDLEGQLLLEKGQNLKEALKERFASKLLEKFSKNPSE